MSKHETYAEYIPHIRARWKREQSEWEARRARAWQDARAAAEILYTRFGATQVFAFGSLTRAGMYDERSDIDLAVSGIPASRFFRASAEAAAVCQFELDLIDLTDCSPTLRDEILQTGVRL